MANSVRRFRNPQGEGGRLRAELIAAAGRVLAGSPNGTGLSLRAVAREAGVAAPSVYLQFADKTALMRAVIDQYFDELREAVIDASATAGDPMARLRAGCLAYCRFALERPGAYAVLFSHEQPVASALSAFGAPDDTGARAFATLVDALGDCMADGSVPPGDPFRLAVLLWSAMHGYVTLVQARGGFPWEPLEVYLDDLLTTLAREPRSLPPPATPAADHPATEATAAPNADAMHEHRTSSPQADADGGTL